MGPLRGETPRPVLIYGGLGLIPFVGPPLIAAFRPDLAGLASTVLAIYGALILSFLGGARWALAATAARPDPWLISLSMAPTVAGLGLMSLPAELRAEQLLTLALALAVQGAWDVMGEGLPEWYGRLRLSLTIGAVAGLVLGAVFVHG